jgi:hypothetical protein
MNKYHHHHHRTTCTHRLHGPISTFERDACSATLNRHEAVRTMFKALIADEGIQRAPQR